MSPAEFRCVWRYRVPRQKREAFLAAYGAGGDWDRLFATSEAHRGTELVESSFRNGADLVFVTIDRWTSRAAREAFLAAHREAYDALDRRCQELTLQEEELVAGDIVRRGDIVLRHEPRAGDLGLVTWLHGRLYREEEGYDSSFEAYVAGPLAEFALKRSPRERLWIAERGRRALGCIAVVEAAPDVAQLRWFLVLPEARGKGLGGLLMDACLAFAREQGYGRMTLWTVAGLEAAARLYRRSGFQLVESRAARRWGRELVEERHELLL